MKKKIILLLLLILPIKVYALTGSTSITCNKTTLSPGDTATCTIKGTVNGDTVSGIDAKITVGSNLTVESVTKASGWEGDSNDVNIQYYTSSNKSGTFDIASCVIKASTNVTAGADTSVSLTSTKFTSGSDFLATDISNSSQNIRIPSSVNTLSSLAISTGTLTPAFNANTISYTASTEETSVTITANKTDDKSSISGDVGTKNLKYGSNEFSVIVTSETGAKKTYILNITRPDNRDTDNKLKSLKLNDEEIELKEDVLAYSLNVDKDVDELVIEAVLNSTKSRFADGFGPRTIKLAEGKNIIDIQIISENETTKIYTLTVTRGSSKAETVTETVKGKSTTTTGGGTSNSVSGNDELVNPKTGTFEIVIVSGILVFCLIIFIIIFFRWGKKDNNNNESDNNNT